MFLQTKDMLNLYFSLGLIIDFILWQLCLWSVGVRTRSRFDCDKMFQIYIFCRRNKHDWKLSRVHLKNIWYCHSPVTPPQPTKTAHFHSSDIFCRFKLPTCSNGMKKLLKKCLTAGEALLMHLCSLCPWIRANTNAKVQSVVDITALKSAK